ncbi:MAG: RagB/SusD family nutrient uptake outer membrane protein [Treponema sp.]|nr:RagB/SusD family nutrient uptake outer membrane protein [Treponema sp.]
MIILKKNKPALQESITKVFSDVGKFYLEYTNQKVEDIIFIPNGRDFTTYSNSPSGIIKRSGKNFVIVAPSRRNAISLNEQLIVSIFVNVDSLVINLKNTGKISCQLV